MVEIFKGSSKSSMLMETAFSLFTMSVRVSYWVGHLLPKRILLQPLITTTGGGGISKAFT